METFQNRAQRKRFILRQSERTSSEILDFLNKEISKNTKHKAEIMNKINNGCVQRLVKDCKLNSRMIYYKNDKEIQKYIKSLLCIMNKKRATVILALILLKKYHGNYYNSFL